MSLIDFILGKAISYEDEGFDADFDPKEAADQELHYRQESRRYTRLGRELVDLKNLNQRQMRVLIIIFGLALFANLDTVIRVLELIKSGGLKL